MITLPSATRIGLVELNVRDLDRVAAFYRDTLGMRELARDADAVTLGADRPALRLHRAPDAKPRAPRQAGLYHVAYVLPSRADLGRFVQFLIDTATPVEGASDHAVSEAIYLHDPEHNGIEVYADRPREAWPRTGERIDMSTDAMDVESVLAEGRSGAWRGWPDGARVGHVHLQVNDVPAAPHALGLRAYEIEVPAEGYEALVKRMGGSDARDPSGNVVKIVRA